ncbi:MULTISPECIES: hypothetical protein [unclassified Microbacterium]|uniref:hypothetical protein n=1 Tax=unclassified Microbacterium TaxID=2609290 RepID=UPI003018F3DE
MTVEERAKWLSEKSLARVRWAQERSNFLVEDISRWRKPDPARTTMHFKEAPECGWYVRLDAVDPPPRLDQWGIMLGEIAHHLRSVLNTTLTRIVEAEGGNPAKSLQYPIAYSPAKWREARKRGLLKGLPERVVRAVYACQPFVWAGASGTSPEDNVLSVLAWLNNQDKHRVEIRGEFSASWVAYEGRIITPDGTSRLVRPTLRYDWSLEPGSRIIDADTSPHVVAGMARTTLDLQIEVMVADELGKTTVLQRLLEETWNGFQQAQVGLIMSWADENADFDKFAGATDFKAGGAFGRAAVDSTHGTGTWNQDIQRRQRVRNPFALDHDRSEPVPRSETQRIQLPELALPSEEVRWDALKGLLDVHSPPRTWRGNGPDQ